VIAHEKSRPTRLVEITRRDGTTERRTEELVRGRWQQAGEHTRVRGEIVEQAARRQVDEELIDEKAGRTATPAGKEKLVDHHRIHHQDDAGRGFDDVIVEFRGDPPEAYIRIVETKDYPNGTVPLGDITAIRKNMDKNLDRLISMARRAQRGDKDDVGGLDKLPDVQRDAIVDALREKRVQVEMRLGPSTTIDEATLGTVKQEIEDRFGAGSFIIEPKSVNQGYIDDVITDRYGKPKRRRR
jgi:hypothetical protein